MTKRRRPKAAEETAALNMAVGDKGRVYVTEKGARRGRRRAARDAELAGLVWGTDAAIHVDPDIADLPIPAEMKVRLQATAAVLGKSGVDVLQEALEAWQKQALQQVLDHQPTSPAEDEDSAQVTDLLAALQRSVSRARDERGLDEDAEIRAMAREIRTANRGIFDRLAHL